MMLERDASIGSYKIYINGVEIYSVTNTGTGGFKHFERLDTNRSSQRSTISKPFQGLLRCRLVEKVNIN